MKKITSLAVALCTCGLAIFAGDIVQSTSLVPEAAQIVHADTASPGKVFRYRMAGKVRLLLFWVGREDVGGGSIGLSKTAVDGGEERQLIEVLFGSNASRVPGKINRWGYGRESSSWSSAGASTKPHLVSTTFEGFMRHSNEESLSEVRTKAAQERNESLFWYDGIQSQVTADECLATIHFFSQEKDFNYLEPGGVECGYRARLKAGPPDRTRVLRRSESSYSEPFGFLTALQSLMQELSTGLRAGTRNWSSARPSRAYLYNGKAYRLAVSGVEAHRDYTLHVKSTEKPTRFADVVEADFRVTNVKSGETHDFSIWFPVSGPLENVPLLIIDKPRWWLRVELTLEAESARQGGLPRQGGLLPKCDK